jgi:hypothetical protein
MLQSKITIEIDYENNNEPVIQIIAKDSEDIRDGLIKSFYQKLGGSSWCKIRFAQDLSDSSDPEKRFKRIFITPIPEKYLKAEAEIMLEQHRVREVFETTTAKNGQ